MLCAKEGHSSCHDEYLQVAMYQRHNCTIPDYGNGANVKPARLKLNINSVHDGDIIPMLAALDIMHSPTHLPVTHRPPARAWRTSQVVPMGGRIILERLTCSPDAAHRPSSNRSNSPHHHHAQDRKQPHRIPSQQSRPHNATFVRININDGIVALPGCSNSGPGSSCPLDEFLAHVKRRGEEVGEFRELCGLEPGAPGRITFLHQ